jgi:hypothetical protein
MYQSLLLRSVASHRSGSEVQKDECSSLPRHTTASESFILNADGLLPRCQPSHYTHGAAPTELYSRNTNLVNIKTAYKTVVTFSGKPRQNHQNCTHHDRLGWPLRYCTAQLQLLICHSRAVIMLCETCANIFRGSYPTGEKNKHHASIQDLQRSALDDCRICRVLWTEVSSLPADQYSSPAPVSREPVYNALGRGISVYSLISSNSYQLLRIDVGKPDSSSFQMFVFAMEDLTRMCNSILISGILDSAICE